MLKFLTTWRVHTSLVLYHALHACSPSALLPLAHCVPPSSPRRGSPCSTQWQRTPLGLLPHNCWLIICARYTHAGRQNTGPRHSALRPRRSWPEQPSAQACSAKAKFHTGTQVPMLLCCEACCACLCNCQSPAATGACRARLTMPVCLLSAD